jgi:hypothetical protein
MRTIVGFDRKIKREWLDAVADRVAQGQNASQLRSFLDKVLQADHPNAKARRNTMTVLMRIWMFVPNKHEHIRRAASDLLYTIPASDRLWLHWGMASLAYPLFRDTATAIGRLLKLQDTLTLAQLQRRLIDVWGDRSTVKRAFQRIVRSMIEWGTLEDTDAPGHFHGAARLTTESKPLQLWYLHVSHIATGREMIESGQLINLPSSFPFNLTVGKADLRQSDDFTIIRQGVDMDMVAVTNNGVSKTLNVANQARGSASAEQLSIFQQG